MSRRQFSGQAWLLFSPQSCTIIYHSYYWPLVKTVTWLDPATFSEKLQWYIQPMHPPPCSEHGFKSSGSREVIEPASQDTAFSCKLQPVFCPSLCLSFSSHPSYGVSFEMGLGAAHLGHLHGVPSQLGPVGVIGLGEPRFKTQILPTGGTEIPFSTLPPTPS